MRYSMEELLEIVTFLSEEYTGKESTSIPYQKARQLMEAAIYCINQVEGEEACVPAGNLTAKEAYFLGLQKIEDKAYELKQLYEKIQPDFETYGTKNLEETFLLGIPEFLLHYDMKYKPMDHILTLDYPLIFADESKCGIDRILAYVKGLELEQQLFLKIPREYGLAVLKNYHASYTMLMDNVARPILRNLLLNLLVENRPFAVEFSEEKKRRVEKIITERTREELEAKFYQLLKQLQCAWYPENQMWYTYFSYDISEFCVELKKMSAWKLYVGYGKMGMDE